MDEPLQDPIKLDSYAYRDEDGWSSVEESPTINRAANRDISDELNEDGVHMADYSRARDLSFLTSANFSQTSLGGDESPIQSRDLYGRRYSASLQSSPGPQTSRSGPSRPRPKSAFFLAENSLVEDKIQPPVANAHSGRARPKSALFAPDNSLIEDQQLMSPINNSYRAAAANKRNYVPPPILVPPITSRSSSPTRSTSPSRSRHLHPKSPSRRSSSPSKIQAPFNFQPQEIMFNNNSSSASLVVKPAHRKGHKYKHSSVSMNFFQEPAPQIIEKQLSSLPDSYPIPTFRECVSSLTRLQRWKVAWSVVHLLTSLIVFLAGHKIHAPELATIAHFVFYDSLGCFTTVMVDVMSNFEVWSHPSITFPFGLERLEVLMGFALAASLVMVGLDLLSHSFEEFLSFVLSIEDNGSHSHHIHRNQERDLVDSLFYFGALVMSMAVTSITSNFILASEKLNNLIMSDETPNFTHKRSQTKTAGILDNSDKHDHLGKASKLAKVITKYPTHVLTLAYALFLVISPLISGITAETFEIDINEVTSLLVSLLFSLTGWKLVKALGGILILSYPSTDYDYHQLKTSLVANIEDLDCFKSTYTIDKLFITKFSYNLFVIGMKIRMSGGNSDDEVRIRFEINRLVRRQLRKENLALNDRDIEITIDIDRL